MILEEEKYLTRRCPRLGGAVSFRYCRTCEGEKQVCWKIIDCWWEIFDVVRYLQDTLTAGQFQDLQERRPKPKLNQLVEITNKVCKTAGNRNFAEGEGRKTSGQTTSK